MINVNWSTLLLQIFNFVVMAVILTRFFFKPVMRILDERSKKVTSALDQAEQREKEATEMYAEYQKKLAEMQEQMRALRQQAENELEETRRRVLEETRDELRHMRDRTEKEIEDARQQAIYQHRLELGRLTTTLAARMMREAGGEAFQRTVLDEFLARLSTMSAEVYQDALRATEAETLYVDITSAVELNGDGSSRIEERVRQMADRPVEISYQVDPALVAGVTVRFGDLLIDGSIAGQLQNLNERYAADLERTRV